MSLFAELKRRNVFRVGVAYLAASWLLIEVLSALFEIFGSPDWVLKSIVGLLAVGLPIALVFSWAYELTPEGLVKTEAIDRSGATDTGSTGKRLDQVTIGLIVLALGVLLIDRMGLIPDLAETRSPVVAESPEPAETPGATEAPPVSDKSLAVLPFANMSAEPENEYFADGLSEELLNVLAQVPDLLVAGRTSSFAYKGHDENLTVIGATLGVANLLEGSVRRQGDQVRVTAQLVRASDGFHLWSQTYDRTMDDVFAIQDDIARNVVDALAIVLDEDARRRMEQAGVRNVDAFVAYQKGNELFAAAHLDKPLVPTLKEANEYYDQAIAAAPDFAAAWSRKADYFAHQLLDPETPAEQRERALEQHRKVMDQAYSSARDPTRRTFIDVDRILFSDDWSTLTDRADQALSSEACPSPAWIPLLGSLGYEAPLIAMRRRQLECDPLVGAAWWNLATLLIADNQFDEARAVVESARKKVGNNSSLDGTEVMLLTREGRYEEAMKLADTIPMGSEFWALETRVWPLAAQNRIEEGQAMRQKVAAEAGRHWLDGLTVLGVLGDRDGANATAARFDVLPAGPMILLNAVSACACGAPFDLEATPNFAARLKESGLPWPPPFSLIDFPAKDW